MNLGFTILFKNHQAYFCIKPNLMIFVGLLINGVID